MTGVFEICGDKFLLVFQGPPDERLDLLFRDLLTEVWRERVPIVARQAIFARHSMPTVLVGSRLSNYRSVELGGKKGQVPWPLAEAGPEGILFSCDRMRIFDLPKPWTLMVIGEELAHAYLIATKHPSHTNPPATTHPDFVDYDKAREGKMQDVLFDEWGFDREEYVKMLIWMRDTECGLKPAKE